MTYYSYDDYRASPCFRDRSQCSGPPRAGIIGANCCSYMYIQVRRRARGVWSCINDPFGMPAVLCVDSQTVCRSVYTYLKPWREVGSCMFTPARRSHPPLQVTRLSCIVSET